MTKVCSTWQCRRMNAVQRHQKFNPWSKSEILEEFAFHSPLDVVQSLGHFKNHLISFPKWSLEQKRDLLLKISQQIILQQQEIVRLECLHQGLPQQFVEAHVFQWVLGYIQTFVEELECSPELIFRPVGLVALLPHWQLGFRQIAERLIPALVTGNCVLIKTDPDSRMSAKLWKKILDHAGLSEEIVQFVDGDETLGLFMMKHPAFKSICYSGSTEKAESLWSSLPFFRKNYSLHMSAKNSLVILPEASDEQIQQNLNSCWMSYGGLNLGMHRIFCADKDVQRVCDLIAADLQNTNWTDENPKTSAYGVRFHTPPSNLLQKLRSEVGSFVVEPDQEGHRPLVYLNLPYCSELQQDPAAFVVVNSVKYTHEVVKWINNGYLGHSTLIVGPVEKAHQLGLKMEVGHVWENHWLKTDNARMVIHGQKLSHRGETINQLQSKLWQY